jgi:hypothetical protein
MNWDNDLMQGFERIDRQAGSRLLLLAEDRRCEPDLDHSPAGRRVQPGRPPLICRSRCSASASASRHAVNLSRTCAAGARPLTCPISTGPAGLTV